MNIVHGHDPDGTAIASVHMKNHPEPAVIYQDDYERVIAEVGNVAWFAFSDGQGRTYVSVQPRGGVPRVMVARLLVPCPKGMQVRYADHNRLNLRRDNLVSTRNPYSGLPEPSKVVSNARTQSAERAATGAATRATLAKGPRGQIAKVARIPSTRPAPAVVPIVSRSAPGENRRSLPEPREVPSPLESFPR